MDTLKTLSVVIRVRNAAEDLRCCLEKVTEQSLPEGYTLEIVVVDNESSDNSAEVARHFEAIVVFLPVLEFSWGRALNRGVSKATGEIVLLLSADAYPADKNWVREMIKPFKDPHVAAVYGKQIPRPDAPIEEIIRLKKTFGEKSKLAKKLPRGFSPRGGTGFPVSNACAAIRKKVWETVPYDEEISGGEEGVWSYHVFQKGFFIGYQETARVFHSHKDPFFRKAWRELELIKKNTELQGKRLSVYVYVHHLLCKCKQRMYNCFFSGCSLLNYIKGILFLPFDCFFFCIAAFFFHKQKNPSRYRTFFWNK